MRTTQQRVGREEPNNTGSGSKSRKTGSIKKRGSKSSSSVGVENNSGPWLGSPEHRAPLAGENLEARIAMRAYELYRQRGGCHGEDQADWFEAERQILSTV